MREQRVILSAPEYQRLLKVLMADAREKLQEKDGERLMQGGMAEVLYTSVCRFH